MVSKDTSITIQWSHDTACFENSVFHYTVTLESAGDGGPSREVRTAEKNITILVASTRQTSNVTITAVGGDRMQEYQSKNVYLQVTAGESYM